MISLCESYIGASVIMAALTLALFLLLPLLGRRYRAKSLYIAWIIVLLGFLIPLRIPNLIPAVTATAPTVVSRPITETAAQDGAEEAQTQAAPATENRFMAVPIPAAQQASQTPPFTWISLITVIWAAGAAAALGVYGIRYGLFLRNIKRWKTVVASESTRRIFVQELQRAKIKRTVKLYCCPGIGSPMIAGVFRPVLLLPDEDLTEEELPLVFRHELIHVKRHDLLIKAALLLAAALHWFNPAVYLLVRQLTFWQESACDEAVILHGSMAEKQFYSETIIRVIRRQVRMKTALSTSFYGGKNGMKRRITAIMESGGKHRGIVLGIVLLAAVSCLGMAFAIDTDPAVVTDSGTVAYVAGIDCDGTRMMTVPSVNDWEIPLVAYCNGVQVRVTETRESSSLPEWNSVEGEDNWAHVLVGGDGATTGISGWIPRIFLSDTKTEELPTATLTTEAPTGFVNVYTLNEMDTNLINAYQEGTEVTLLGQMQQWYQIQIDGKYGFVLRENLAVSDAVQAKLNTFLPFRFDGITRKEYQDIISFDTLYKEISVRYDGQPVEYWSLEDKAWYGQMEETYNGQHDAYYQLPQQDDLPQEQAIDIAWDTFITHHEALTSASRDDYSFNLSFYAIPAMETYKKRWEIKIAPKGEPDNYYQVKIDSPSGEVLGTYGDL